jgi:hypothetical protein
MRHARCALVHSVILYNRRSWTQILPSESSIMEAPVERLIAVQKQQNSALVEQLDLTAILLCWGNDLKSWLYGERGSLHGDCDRCSS